MIHTCTQIAEKNPNTLDSLKFFHVESFRFRKTPLALRLNFSLKNLAAQFLCLTSWQNSPNSWWIFLSIVICNRGGAEIWTRTTKSVSHAKTIGREKSDILLFKLVRLTDISPTKTCLGRWPETTNIRPLPPTVYPNPSVMFWADGKDDGFVDLGRNCAFLAARYLIYWKPNRDLISRTHTYYCPWHSLRATATQCNRDDNRNAKTL